MRDILVVTLFFAAMPIVLLRPWTGMLVWAWIGYMNPHRLAFGFASTFPFALIVFSVMLFAIVFSNERKIPRFSRELVVLCLLLLWFTVTTWLSYNPEFAWLQWEKVMKIQAAIIITLVVIYTRARINALVWAIALSLGFYGVNGVIYVITTGGASYMRGPEGTFIAGNTDLALAMVMILPLLYYLHQHAPRRSLRWGALALMGMTTLSTIATYSRGGLLALLAMGGLLWWKSRHKLPVVIVALILLPIVLFLMPSKWHERMNTIDDYEEDASAMGRINAWRFAVNVFKAHPLGGLGFGTFNPTLFLTYAPNPNDYHDAHSIYFKVLAEHGSVGLILFLAFFSLGWRTASGVVKAAKDRPDYAWAKDLAAMVQTSLFGYAVGGAFLGMCYFDLPYHMVVIVVVLKQVLRDDGVIAQALTPAHFAPLPVVGSPAQAELPPPAGGLSRFPGRFRLSARQGPEFPWQPGR